MSEEKKGTLFLEDMWNEILVSTRKNRNIEPRTHIWATEIGKNFYERYLKMQGVKPTREIEERVLRKFAAGEIFEELIGQYLSKIGLVQSAQEHIVIPETDQHLKVSGKIDYVAGMPNWDEATKAVVGENENIDDLDFSQQVLLKLITEMKEKYPNGLSDVIFEIKTINSMVFWAKKDYLNEAYPFHIMQIYTYLKYKNLPEGHIVYLSKDDLTIKEMVVRYPDEKLEKLWNDDVLAMTNYIRTETEPPKPASVIFDPRGHYAFQKNKVKYKCAGMWKENWEVKFSQYFDMVTGFDTEEEWLNSLKPEISARNKELKEDYIKNNNL